MRCFQACTVLAIDEQRDQDLVVRRSGDHGLGPRARFGIEEIVGSFR
jgi:hypothetical protein